jgi:hypothetical protein
VYLRKIDDKKPSKPQTNKKPQTKTFSCIFFRVGQEEAEDLEPAGRRERARPRDVHQLAGRGQRIPRARKRRSVFYFIFYYYILLL